MDVEARSEATVKPFTATVEECIRVRSGIMRSAMAVANSGASAAEQEAWLEMLDLACRLADEAQAR